VLLVDIWRIGLLVNIRGMGETRIRGRLEIWLMVRGEAWCWADIMVITRIGRRCLWRLAEVEVRIEHGVVDRYLDVWIFLLSVGNWRISSRGLNSWIRGSRR
jgi:hypothetical protein